MIEQILPIDITSSYALSDDPTARLYPEEIIQIGSATEKKLREFATTRNLARKALQELGYPPTAILRGPMGAPIWPNGIVGSMTHCVGYRAVAVAAHNEILSMGIDAEPHEPLPPGVLYQISLASEREWLSRAPDGIHWDRLLFSAKESIYKLWFPLTGLWLDFDEASITFAPDNGSFTAQLLGVSPQTAGYVPNILRGQFLIRDGLILTSVYLR